MDRELTTFIPILIFLVVLLAFVVGAMVFCHWISPRKKTPVKEMPYESGMDPVGDARQNFDVKYYLVAILFLVFDVELLFLYPWAVSAYQPEVAGVPQGLPLGLRSPVFYVMISFLITLAIAYVYAWRKGVFQWR